MNLTKEQDLIRETASKIAQKELAPKAAEIDKTHSFVWEGIKKLGEVDLLGLTIPTEYKGMGMNTYLLFWL